MAERAVEFLAQRLSGSFQLLGMGTDLLADQGLIGRGQNGLASLPWLIIQSPDALLLPSVEPIVDGQPGDLEMVFKPAHGLLLMTQ